jgi:hypothetical protein
MLSHNCCSPAFVYFLQSLQKRWIESLCIVPLMLEVHGYNLFSLLDYLILPELFIIFPSVNIGCFLQWGLILCWVVRKYCWWCLFFLFVREPSSFPFVLMFWCLKFCFLRAVKCEHVFFIQLSEWIESHIFLWTLWLMSEGLSKK